ncbi:MULTISPECIES: DUF262 domain-containing HNH endonuclease family protein [Alphaproteobacteria]|uniref:DUF262 domain-containing HNH endonuclease family protein n=1 Tax=Alphaproteobacteria TaxID=28211 RepID=UPI003299AD76
MVKPVQAKAGNLKTVFTQNHGLVIPPFQRMYAWSNDDIKKFFETIFDSINAGISRSEKKRAFIGGVILISDDNNEEDPTEVKVFRIIDGQQRITTISLIGLCIKKCLISTMREFEAGGRQVSMGGVGGPVVDEAIEWLRRRSSSIDSQLNKLLLLQLEDDERTDRRFPRLSRAPDDQWNFGREALHNFNSPQARLIYSAMHHFLEHPDQRYDYGEFYDDAINTDGRHDQIKGVFKEISASVNVCVKMLTERNGLFPSYSQNDLVDNFRSVCDLYTLNCPENVLELVENDGVHANFKNLFSIFVFAEHLLSRLDLVRITSFDQEQAFELFDTLNSTGVPLTAVDLLRADITEFMIDGNLGEQQAARTSLTKIENFLSRERDQEDEDRAGRERTAAGNLMISIALAQNGSRPGAKLEKQRSFLKSCRNELANDRAASRDMYQGVGYVADACGIFTGARSEDRLPDRYFAGQSLTERNEAKLAVAYLRSMKHRMTYPVVAKLVERVESAQGEAAIRTAAYEFCQGLKAIAAFTTLFRACSGSTAGIDGQYHKLFIQEVAGCPSLARRFDGAKPRDFTVSELRGALLHLVNQKWKLGDSEDTFAEKAAEATRFGERAHSTLCRFALLVAHDRASFSENTDAMLQDGHSALLSPQNWYADEYGTVEHIAPLEPEAGHIWDPNIYGNSRATCIGNLTLMPQKFNSSASNGSWARKHSFFKALACESAPAIEQLFEADPIVAEALEDQKSQIIKYATEVHILRSLARFERLEVNGQTHTDWTEAVINQRGKMLAARLWRRLRPWLG